MAIASLHFLARAAGQAAGAYARQPERDGALIYRSDRGSQYVSIRYSEHLAEAGIEPSVGGNGDSGTIRVGAQSSHQGNRAHS